MRLLIGIRILLIPTRQNQVFMPPENFILPFLLYDVRSRDSSSNFFFFFFLFAIRFLVTKLNALAPTLNAKG